MNDYDNVEGILPCSCGKTPHIQFRKKPNVCYYIECCKHRVEIQPAGVSDAYIESAKEHLTKVWNQSVLKKKAIADKSK